MRKFIFAEGEYYHIFNRGVNRRPICLSSYEYSHAISTLAYYRYSNPETRFSIHSQARKKQRLPIINNFEDPGGTLATIVSYCIMPNHFHILLRQNKPKGISTMLNKFSNSYTKYFNTRNKRSGPLFTGIFKAVHIETDEQLLHVHRYIHLNPFVSNLVNTSKLALYNWSSFPDYLGMITKEDSLCDDKEIIMHHFKGDVEKYKSFIFDQAEYAKEIKNIQHLLLEDR